MRDFEVVILANVAQSYVTDNADLVSMHKGRWDWVTNVSRSSCVMLSIYFYQSLLVLYND